MQQKDEQQHLYNQVYVQMMLKKDLLKKYENGKNVQNDLVYLISY